MRLDCLVKIAASVVGIREGHPRVIPTAPRDLDGALRQSKGGVEIAGALEISERSAHREWTFARARLFELFTSHMEGTDGREGGYQASKLQKDKLTMFVLILYVIAAGGRDMKASSLNQLCKDLKLDVKDASMMLREAGFVVKKSGVGDIGVSLPVPLKFPPPKRGKRT